MGNKLDLETFGEIMDKVIEDNEVCAVLLMPKGTQECEMKSNIGVPTIDLYILLAAIPQLVRKINEQAGGDAFDLPRLAEAVGKQVQEGILEAMEGDGANAGTERKGPDPVEGQAAGDGGHHPAGQDLDG